MSIIYDALNKVEKKKVYNNKRSKAKWLAALVIAVVVIILLLSNVFFKNKIYVSQKKLRKKTAKIHLNPAKKKYSSENLILEGIIYNNETPTAVINGKLLKEGDRISAFRVSRINKDSVKLFDSKNNKGITLSFK